MIVSRDSFFFGECVRFELIVCWKFTASFFSFVGGIDFDITASGEAKNCTKASLIGLSRQPIRDGLCRALPGDWSLSCSPSREPGSVKQNLKKNSKKKETTRPERKGNLFEDVAMNKNGKQIKI